MPRPPAPDARPPEGPDLSGLVGVKLGNYRLERLIGHGRMGFVYLAKDEALLRPTAIKVLSWRVSDAQGQDPVQWFLAEARLVARINHPRVVQIYGAARQGEYCYIAMEYVAGTSAEAVLERTGRMAPEVATDVLLQAASALHAAHRSGIVHRDVKPANLLVGEGGVTKLGDFGMALGPAELRIGNAHLRVGTPYYTAPEIWLGEAAIAASDIYSLGATYFHLLTGRPPYPGADVATVEQGHLRAPVPDPREFAPKLPASCAELVRRVLAKASRDRHASAQLLLWDARRVLQDVMAAAPHAPARRKPDPAPAPAPPRDAPLARERVPEPPAVRHPGLPPAPGPLAGALGFVHRPFCDVEPGACPPEVDPLGPTRRRILEHLDGETPVVVVTGADGSGRVAVCRGVSAELGRSRLVLLVDAGAGDGGPPLLQRLCRAAGVSEEPTEESTLDALIERLAEERQERGSTPLVVVDGVVAGHPSTVPLARLVGAGLWTRSFEVVLAGGPGIVEALARSGVDLRHERVPEIPIPPIDRAELPAYFRRWLDATLGPRAAPIVVSRDAFLLLALRSEGEVERVHCIAENMLVLAAAERRRTVTSWDAWTASDQERWSEAHAAHDLPRRPEGWPPADVADVLDACRRGAGLPPWPRAGVRR